MTQQNRSYRQSPIVFVVRAMFIIFKFNIVSASRRFHYDITVIRTVWRYKGNQIGKIPTYNMEETHVLLHTSIIIIIHSSYALNTSQLIVLVVMTADILYFNTNYLTIQTSTSFLNLNQWTIIHWPLTITPHILRHSNCFILVKTNEDQPRLLQFAGQVFKG